MAAAAAAGVLGLTGAGAQSDAGGADAEPHAAIEACIRANAARVERAFDSLIEATSFLTGSVCLKDVADAAEVARTAQQERQRARMEEICSEFDGQTPMQMVGNPMAAQCQSLQYQDIWLDSDPSVFYIGSYASGQVPAEMTSLAARLLLDARLARLEAGE